MTDHPYNPAQVTVDCMEFFDRVDKKNGGDGVVWAKCTAKKATQAIVEIQNSMGRPIFMPPIKVGTPLCLTRYVPSFELLRNAEQIQQNVANGNIKLMTSADAWTFFNRKAERMQSTADQLMRQADAEAGNFMAKKGVPSNELDQNQSLARPIQTPEGYEDPALLMHPKIDDICNQVAPWLKPGECLSANAMFDVIYDLEDMLTIHDLTRLESGGRYPTVKRWAQKKMLELSGEVSADVPAEGEESADGLVYNPPKIPKSL